jgi:hypothetical protein
MRVIRLQAENVKRLKAVDVTPPEHVVQVQGRNAQGKTSLLDSIMLALGGKSVAPPQVVRRGETEARVVLELDDLTVERKWAADEAGAVKTYLEVRSKEGVKQGSPQTLLDKLTGALSFDPLAFLRYDARKQLDLLRSLVGVDTTDLDNEHRRLYDERTVVGRECDRLKARIPAPVNAPDAEVSADAVLAELERLADEKASRDETRRRLAEAKNDEARAKNFKAQADAEVERLARLLKAAQETADLAAGEAEMAAAARASLEEDVAALPPDPDTADLRRRLADVEATNVAVRAKRERERIIEEFKAAQGKGEALSVRLAEIRAEKERRLAAAPWPVEGLGFYESGLTYKGLPFEQASGAEQLRVALAMGLALHPQLRVFLIRDASLLDADSVAIVARFAAEHDAQVWLEQVGADGTGIIIEDGEVRTPPAGGGADAGIRTFANGRGRIIDE